MPFDILSMLAQAGTPGVIMQGSDIANDMAPAGLDDMLNDPSGIVPAPSPYRIQRRAQPQPEINPEDFAAPQYYAGGAEDQPGIMQAPEAQNLLRRNLMDALSGLNTDVNAVDLDNSEADRRNRDDMIRANFLAPLLGFTKGNLKTSMAASQDLRDSIDRRNEQRRQHRGDRMDILKNLAKVVQDADPNDINYMLKREKQALADKSEARRLQQSKDTMTRHAQNLSYRKEMGASRLKLQAEHYAQLAKDKSLDRAERSRRAEEYLKRADTNIELRQQALQNQMLIAQQRDDWQTYNAIKEELQENEREQMQLYSNYVKLLGEEGQQQQAAAKAAGEPLPVQAASAIDQKAREMVNRNSKPLQLGPIPGLTKEALQQYIQQRAARKAGKK